MKHFILWLILLSVASLSSAQHTVTGLVTDSVGASLPGAHAVLFRNDTVKIAAVVTNVDGIFKIPKVLEGWYTLEVSFIGYKDHTQNIELSKGKNKVHDVGNVTLKQDDLLMDEVSIEAERIPITVKGDSIEYDADAYKTRPNEAIPDLLRKMPGMEIDEDGNVIAHGKKVEKIYVDGRSFFGKDAKSAMDALNSDLIDKIQVIKDQSPRSRFTGIRSGNEPTALNFQLKEDKKKFFGNMAAGYGTDDNYHTKGTVNSMKGKTRLSIAGNSDNVNGQESQSRNVGNMNGLNENHNAGININTEVKNKYDLDLSYNFRQNNSSVISTTDRQNFVEEQILRTFSSTEQQSQSNSHTLNLQLLQKFGGDAHLSVGASGSISPGKSNSTSLSQSFNPEGVLGNENSSDNRVVNDAFNFNSMTNYMRKFGKKGHHLMANITMGAGNSASDRDLLSQISFFDQAGTPTDSLVDQVQNQRNAQFNINGSLNFEQNIKSKTFLSYGYSFGNNNDESNRDHFDIRDQVLIENEDLTIDYDRKYWGRFPLNYPGAGGSRGSRIIPMR